MNITFPKTAFKPLYYDTYFKYVANMLIYAGCKLDYFDNGIEFKTIINGKTIYFDYADDSELLYHKTPNFKFHYRGGVKGVYAFPPPSFYDWEQYYTLSKQIIYKASGHISCRQTPYATGRLRRNLVRSILKGQAELDLINHTDYLKDVQNCLVSVCAPGHNAHILDRGQFQYMGLGACTISPYLPENLPFDKTLIPGHHYIECREDFSDLLDKIEWCKTHTKECITIGQNAKTLFQETSTPEKVKLWIQSKL